MSLNRKRKLEYCEVLGVPLDADENTVKKAYKRLALELHPDRPNNKGKEEEAGKQFQLVTEAYLKLIESYENMKAIKTCIKTPEVRSGLDFMLFLSQAHRNVQPTHVVQNSGVPFKSKPKTTPKRGQSLKAVLKLSEEESSHGCSKTIEYTRTLNCPSCEGTGNKKDSNPVICNECGGKGIRTTIINGKNLGESNISTACRGCHSSGWVGAKDCQECDGTGKSSVKRIRTIEVPSGTLTGMKTIFECEGDEGMDGGPTGDLVLWYEVEGTPLADTGAKEGRKRGRKPKPKPDMQTNATSSPEISKQASNIETNKIFDCKSVT